MPGVMVAAGSSRPGRSLDGRQERDHDLRAALFGIEASAEGLCRHRERLTPEQFDQLAAGLAAEVRRLRSLVDGDGIAPGTFDLGDAIDPVVACAAGVGSGRARLGAARHRGHRPAATPRRRSCWASWTTPAGTPLAHRSACAPRCPCDAVDALRRGSRPGDPWSLARAHLRTGGARRRQRRLRAGPVHRPASDDGAGRVDQRPRPPRRWRVVRVALPPGPLSTVAPVGQARGHREPQGHADLDHVGIADHVAVVVEHEVDQRHRRGGVRDAVGLLGDPPQRLAALDRPRHRRRQPPAPAAGGAVDGGSAAAVGRGRTTGAASRRAPASDGAGGHRQSTPAAGARAAAGPSANRRPSRSISQRPPPSSGMTATAAGDSSAGSVSVTPPEGCARLALLGRDEAVVGVDRRAVGLADLEVEVRHRAFGVAAVAHVADHLTGPHRAADGQLRRDLPLVTGEAVIGARACRC